MRPILQAIVLADKVYEDGATKKKIIAGTFNTIYFRRPKSERAQAGGTGGGPEQAAPEFRQIKGGQNAGSPSLYLSLTEVRGKTPLEFRYVDLMSDEVLIKAEIEITGIDDPLTTAELHIPLPVLPTPHEGIFSLEVLSRNELLGAVRITVKELKDESQ